MLKYILIISCVFIIGCKKQDQSEMESKPDSNATMQNSGNEEIVEVKEKEILKPGVLKVEVPEDIPLPESAIVVSGANLGSSGKTHYFIQIPDIETPQGVAEYFTTELPKHEWVILIKREERIQNVISLDFKKENRIGTVASHIDPNRAGAIVLINLQEIEKQ